MVDVVYEDVFFGVYVVSDEVVIVWFVKLVDVVIDVYLVGVGVGGVVDVVFV